VGEGQRQLAAIDVADHLLEAGCFLSTTLWGSQHCHLTFGMSYFLSPTFECRCVCSSTFEESSSSSKKFRFFRQIAVRSMAMK
jgi:hypothetical protein